MGREEAFGRWWECEKVRIFWHKIQKHAARITSVDAPMEPEMLLLDVWNAGDPEGATRALIFILLAAVRIAIASSWMTPSSISIQIWFDKI